MSELTLKTNYDYPLRGLVDAALETQTRVLLSGIHRTEANLRGFEERHGIGSTEFERRYADDEIEESLEYVEWLGELRMLRRLQEKLDVIRDISIAN